MKQLPVCHEVDPYLRLPVDFLQTNQYNVDKHFRVSDARHSGFSMRIGLECGFILKDDISQSLYTFKPTWSILTVWQYFPFGLSPYKGHLLCIINIEHPKMSLKYLLKVILLSYKICTTRKCTYTQVDQLIHS